jgi:hypothetical protein
MQPRQLARATTFGPDALKVIFSAFDGAWNEIAPRISTDAAVVEASRASLAILILGLANADGITPDGLRTVAVAMFCAKYRIEDEPAARLKAAPQSKRVACLRQSSVVSRQWWGGE